MWRFKANCCQLNCLPSSNDSDLRDRRRRLAIMKRIGCILLSVVIFAVMGKAQNATKPETVFVIQKPTVMAFFTPVTEKELENDPDLNEVLSDFQLYNSEVHEPFARAGIDFQEADALSFKIRIGKTVQTFRTGKIGVGYYFIAPGKEPRVEYGVMTNTDLLEIARKYFGIPIP